MLEAGFLPDAISSDVHTLSVNGPAFDQLVTMLKFLSTAMCWARSAPVSGNSPRPLVASAAVSGVGSMG
jgi:predicted amidohydrolase